MSNNVHIFQRTSQCQQCVIIVGIDCLLSLPGDLQCHSIVNEVFTCLGSNFKWMEFQTLEVNKKIKLPYK